MYLYLYLHPQSAVYHRRTSTVDRRLDSGGVEIRSTIRSKTAGGRDTMDPVRFWTGIWTRRGLGLGLALFIGDGRRRGRHARYAGRSYNGIAG